MKGKTYKKVFVITKDKSEEEWADWCENDGKEILYVNENCTVGEKYSKDNVMIILNGCKYTFVEVCKVIKNIMGIETWNEDAALMQIIAFACHDTENKLKDKFRSGVINYTISGGDDKESELTRWNKLFKPIAEAIKYKRVSFFKKRFEHLLDHCNGKPLDEIPWPGSDTLQKILRIFLPLDIDMQALEAAKDKEGYLSDMYKDLESLYKSVKNKDEHFRQKLYDLWYFLDPEKYKEKASHDAKNFDPIPVDKTENLKLHAGFNCKKPEESPVYKFFESLDNKLLGGKFKVNDGYSFHDWYRKLGECLKAIKVY